MYDTPMKTRNGFVSNSSSSSFIFMLNRAPENAGDLYSLLYPSGRQWVLDPYPSIRDGRDMNVSTLEAANRIWDQIRGKTNKTNWTAIRRELTFRGIPFDDFLSRSRHGAACWCSADPPPTFKDVERFIKVADLGARDMDSPYFLVGADPDLLSAWCYKHLENETKQFILEKKSYEEKHDFFVQFEKERGSSDNHKAANAAWYKSKEFSLLNVEQSKIWKSRWQGEQHRALTKCVTAMLKYLRAVYDKGNIYVAKFSDEDGDDVLEHGKTFDDVPHITISHH